MKTIGKIVSYERSVDHDESIAASFSSSPSPFPSFHRITKRVTRFELIGRFEIVVHAVSRKLLDISVRCFHTQTRC